MVSSVIFNLIDIILLIGFVITVIGFIFVISSFFDLSAVKDTVLEEVPSSPNSNTNSDSNVLKIPKNNKSKYGKAKHRKVKKSTFQGENIEAPDNEVKEVLNVKEYNESPSFEDNQLFFTPNYEKPVPVTRKPKKRSKSFNEEPFPSGIPYQNDLNKTNQIREALSSHYDDEIEKPAFETDNLGPRDIKIDVNNPESLPIPKSLKSFIVSNREAISSSDVFEDLTFNSTKDFMLEIPNLAKLNDRLLSYVPTTNSRIIIEEFDINNTSYVLLLSSLLNQKVHIKTLPKISITNLITDNSALILTDSLMENEEECGAVYENLSEISQIKEIFERSWNLAKDIDMNLLNS